MTLQKFLGSTVAIECDERQHSDEKDEERQAYIENKLGCTFIRYKPHLKGFCIFEVINQIHKHIQAKDALQSI